MLKKEELECRYYLIGVEREIRMEVFLKSRNLIEFVVRFNVI